jgi:hypothetical protein
VLVWKFLHIVSMFAAVTLLFALDIIFFRVAESGDVRAMRRIGRSSQRVVTIGVITFFVAVGFGFATAITGDLDLTAPWLLIAYGLVAVIIFLGGAIESPYLSRIGKAAEDSPEDAPSPELAALLASPLRHLTYVSALLYAAVIFDMVVKPFS